MYDSAVELKVGLYIGNIMYLSLKTIFKSKYFIWTINVLEKTDYLLNPHIALK